MPQEYKYRAIQQPIIQTGVYNPGAKQIDGRAEYESYGNVYESQTQDGSTNSVAIGEFNHSQLVLVGVGAPNGNFVKLNFNTKLPTIFTKY